MHKINKSWLHRPLGAGRKVEAHVKRLESCHETHLNNFEFQTCETNKIKINVFKKNSLQTSGMFFIESKSLDGKKCKKMCI